MEPKITNIKTSRCDLLSTIQKNSKLLSLEKQLHDLTKLKLKELLPQLPRFDVDFQLHGTSALANCIRIVLMAEIPIWSIHLENSHVETSDPKNTLFDVLATVIHSIPVNQTIFNKLEKTNDLEKTIRINANVKAGDKPRYVTSADLKFTLFDGKKNTELKSCCESTFPITQIEQNKYLRLKNMELRKGYGVHEGCGHKFSTVANIRYNINDVKHHSDGGPSSLCSSPSNFSIGYTTYNGSYDDPLEPLRAVFDVIMLRISNIREYFVEQRTSPTYFQSETGVVKFVIDEQPTNSIVRFIHRVAFDMKPDIEFIASNDTHPLSSQQFISLVHDKPIEFMIKACDKALNIVKKLNKF